MQKLGFPAMKSFENLRSIRGSVPGFAKTFPVPSSRPSSEASLGSFANLKLTAEKLVKEQASVKTDLEMANSKLRKAVEQIHGLEMKLQDASNENAKLKVKQKEDAKLWKGLDSKLSSTKTLCGQLTETLQHLASQTLDAEKDKKFFEEKLLESSKALDDLNCQINGFSVKLKHAEENIKKGKQEMAQVKEEKEEIVETLRAERCATENLKKEKDAVIKHLEDTVEENKVHLKGLDSELQKVLKELSLKEGMCKYMEANLENLNKENISLKSINDDSAKKLLDSREEIKNLEDIVHGLTSKVVELDKHSTVVSNNLSQLLLFMETCQKLAHQEKELAAKYAKVKFEQLLNQHLSVRTENEAFIREIEMLNSKILELQKAQEFVMVQHAEECRIQEDKVRKLESEAENHISKKNDLEMLVSKLNKQAKHLSDSSSTTENKMKDLLVRIAGLESENQEMQEKMKLMLQESADKVETLQGVISEHEQHVASLENQISQLHGILDEKEQANIQLTEKKKLLEDKNSEIQALLASAESNLSEARRQHDLMLEGKQLELTKHLKDISQKNDQAINDIRKKYEMEKLEIIDAEKEKADKLIKEMERKYYQRVNENKEEARQCLLHVQDEHTAKITQIQQEHDQKELSLRSHHMEELQRVQLQNENELREKILSLKKEHEIQIISMRHQHEDEYGKLQEELELQRTKEEKQRALLQLQWKVMDEKSKQDDLEVNSKKEYSISSIKMRDGDDGKGSQLALTRPEKRKKDIDLSGIIRTPVANMLRKVEKGNPGSEICIPKHSRKVTHHEYEVETSNGKTITKRRKTKSTVMFGDPPANKRVKPKTCLATKDVSKVRKVIGGTQPHASNIGDLFSEGSLNPYTDDPYAFD